MTNGFSQSVFDETFLQETCILYDEMIPGLQWFFDQTPLKAYGFQSISDQAHHFSQTTHCFIRSTTRMNSTQIHQMPKLQWIATATSGIDHLDQKALFDRSIEWVDAQGSNAQAVADYTVYALAYLQQIQPISALEKPLKAAVVGCGYVGSAVLKNFQYLGFETLALDPFIDPQRLQTKAHKVVSTEDLQWLQSIQILSIHLPHRLEAPYPTQDWLDEEKLSLLEDNTLVILAGRGENINEQALLKHADRLRLIIDVWPQEPSISKALIHKACFVTPHIAGHSVTGKIKGAWLVLEAFFKSINTVLPIDENIFFNQLVTQYNTSELKPVFHEKILSPELLDIHHQLKAYESIDHSLDHDNRLQATVFKNLRKNYRQHLEMTYEP